MATKPTRWLKIALGTFLILFGAIGHLIPLLPGGVFIAAGLLLLADVIPAVQRSLTRIETRYPTIHAALGRVRRSDGSLALSRVALLLLAVSLCFGIVVYLVFRRWPGY